MLLILKRLLVFLLPFSLILATGIIFYQPKSIYWLPLILLAGISLTIWDFSGRHFTEELKHFLISPLLFILSTFLFLIFIEQGPVRWLIIILAALFLVLFLDSLFSRFYQPNRYQFYSLENIANHLNLISAFLFFSGVYSIIIFLNLSIILLIILVLVITGVLFYQAIWINKITWLKSWSYILINSLVIAEFFLVISFLPTSFYVNGIILATVYYFILGLSRSYLLDKFEKKIIKKYIAVVLIVLIIVLGTARWL